MGFTITDWAVCSNKTFYLGHHLTKDNGRVLACPNITVNFLREPIIPELIRNQNGVNCYLIELLLKKL